MALHSRHIPADTEPVETKVPRSFEADFNSGVYSEQEKAEILDRIEQAASANRLDTDTSAFHPRKRGILFPILVNLLAASLIVGAWFAADSWFKLRQESLHLKTDKLFSTESKLIAKVLEDARAQVEAKNAEIGRIQADLLKTADEKSQLQKTFNSRIATQESLLKEEMATALEAERRRLLGSGLSEAEVNRRLKTFEDQKNAEFTQRLNAFRQQAQSQLDQRNQEYARLQAQLDQTKAQQDSLRAQIEAQTRAREKDLQGQVSSQSSRLQKLEQEKEDLNLFFHTVDAAMENVKAAVSRHDWAGSREALGELKSVLQQADKQASLPVKLRAQAGLVEANLLDTTVAALQSGGASSKETAALQAEITRQRALALQTKTTLESALQQAQTQTKDAEAKAAGLQTALTNQRFESNAGQQAADRAALAMQAQQSQLQDSVNRLTVIDDQLQALQKLFTANYDTPQDRFTKTFDSPEGKAAFPLFDQAWAALSKLWAARPTETAKLYGSVMGVDGTTVTLQPITQLRPQTKQVLEIRRVGSSETIVLGRVPIVSVGPQGVTIQWDAKLPPVQLGDAGYWILPASYAAP